MAPSADRRHLSPRLRAVIAGVLALALPACSDPTTGGAQFCAALRDEMPVLTGKVRTQADIDALVAGYAELDERTPLAIEDSWHTLTELVATAATVVPDDPTSVQTVADAAYAAERSAREVATWVATTCGLAMPKMEGIEGPATTAPPPHSTLPATTQPPVTEPPASVVTGPDGSPVAPATGQPSDASAPTDTGG